MIKINKPENVEYLKKRFDMILMKMLDEKKVVDDIGVYFRFSGPKKAKLHFPLFEMTFEEKPCFDFDVRTADHIFAYRSEGVPYFRCVYHPFGERWAKSVTTGELEQNFIIIEYPLPMEGDELKYCPVCKTWFFEVLQGGRKVLLDHKYRHSHR